MGFRDVLMTLLGFGCIPLALYDAFWGLMAYCWLSFMKPQSLVWSAGTRSARFTFMVAICLILRALATPGRKFRLAGPSTFFVLFWAWMGISVLRSYNLSESLIFYEKFSKIAIAVLLLTGLVRTRLQFKQIFILMAMCPGLYAIRLGLFLLRGGVRTHHGGPLGMDNNDTALFIAIGMPLLAFAVVEVQSRWRRRGLYATALLAVPAVIAGGSRGGMLAMGAAGIITLWRKTNWVKVAIYGMLLLPVAVALVPERTMTRYETLENYEQDESARMRLWAWETSLNMGQHRPLTGIGIGQGVFLQEYNRFKTHPVDEPHVAHSIWFTTLAGTGWVGLGLFVAMIVSAFRMCRRIRKLAASRPDFQWASDYAAGIQCGIVAFCIGGSFLSQVGFEFAYAVFLLAVPLEVIVRRELLIVPGSQELAIDSHRRVRPTRRARPRRLEGAPA